MTVPADVVDRLTITELKNVRSAYPRRSEATAELAKEFAEQIKPLIEPASRAYGSKGPGTLEREASDDYNQLLLEFVARGGVVQELSDELEVPYATLARRLKVARSSRQPGMKEKSREWGVREPSIVKAAAEELNIARLSEDQVGYSQMVKVVEASGISLAAVAEEMGISYYALWSQLYR